MIFSVIFIFCTLVELAIVCQLNRWERERQIGSKVLGHWLNQIRKTRRNENRSNGEGVRRRVPLNSAHSPSNDSPAHNTVITKQTANSIIHQRKPMDQVSFFATPLTVVPFMLVRVCLKAVLY
ncbi:hypothetical protein COOONC_17733 [Cooperia oncophora]